MGWGEHVRKKETEVKVGTRIISSLSVCLSFTVSLFLVFQSSCAYAEEKKQGPKGLGSYALCMQRRSPSRP